MSRRIPPPLPPRRSISTFDTAPLLTGTNLNDPALPSAEEVIGSNNAIGISQVAADNFDENHSEETWKTKMEDVEIQRYLREFAKHVHHLRVASIPPVPPTQERPRLRDYSLPRLKIADESLVESDMKTSDERSSTQAAGEDVPRSVSDEDLVDEGTDWMGFASAYLRYFMGPTSLPPPVEPFTVARLRSNAERLYTVARPMWGRFGTTVGNICLWKNKTTTSLIVLIYAALVITSTLLPAIILLPLYPILKYRLLPSSRLQQYRAALAAQEAFKDVSKWTEELVQLEEPEGDQGLSMGAGINLGLSDSTKDKLQVGTDELKSAFSNKKGAEKDKNNRKRKLRAAIRRYEEAYGAGTVVVIGDLADLHEKLKSLYLWRRPKVAYTFITSLITASLVSYLCPLWLLVKVFQILLGVIMFVVVPLVAAQERYEPMSWLAGSAPTDAEYVLELLKQRAAEGQPLDLPATPSSMFTLSSIVLGPSTSSIASIIGENRADSKTVSKHGKAREIGSRGLGWLETTRKLVSGESSLKISLARSVGDSVPSTTGRISEVKFGERGPRLVLAQGQEPVEDSEQSTYFAQYGRTPGNLRISRRKVSFRGLIPRAFPSGTRTQSSLSTDAGSLTTSQQPVITGTHIDILISDIVGIRKRDKSSLLVVSSNGLELECVDGSTTTFPFIAERDQAFAQILAFSERSFAKV